MKPTDAKIVFLDIETAPNLGWVWGKWEQNVLDNQRDWYILSYAFKRAGDRKVTTVGLIDYPATYAADITDDTAITADLWQLLDSADIIVAHNGDKFDLAKINTRLLKHGHNPPSPYKTVDTLKIARKVFAFDSNKLDDLGRYLGIGRKLPHTGFHLWKGCMSGDPVSWAKMKKYNGHDVELLERFYYLIRKWIPSHPNVNQIDLGNCPKCGSDKLQRRGFSFTASRKRQRLQCQNCSGWSERPAEKVARS